ncbi:hypothetical protein ABIA33_004916 [Streptacidiphilus sp. MAP12-16]|uniref:hypothetical protein n=1 Tax=Streptacidiphilus sp. MAP12-16 TaxID=3156300 RepID=UPI003516FF4A
MSARSDRYAAWSGLLGGALGVVAGIVQAAAGTQLGAWAGSKSNPLPLGLLTIGLSGLALAAALVQLRAIRPPSTGHRAAVAATELVAGLVCFSTVGRLWWAPGALLLSAAAAEISAAPAGVARAVRGAWPAVLTGILGACLMLVAATADTPLPLVLGLAAGLAVAAAPWIAGRSVPVAAGVLLLGALPCAAITWWSAITPLTAVLALVTGTVAIRRRTRPVDTDR